ncbi:GAF and ANTAR domain-containing protein [Arthrobacter pityocampae]|uniref:GAF and ANTAR domain-containing protein n=1 Tax=Arthrobacter pityocampae TaxID=547334 RepID=UPI0037359C12
MNDPFTSPTPRNTATTSTGDDALRHRLHASVAASPDLLAYLDSLTSTAVEALSSPGQEVFCGVTLIRARKATTVASSSDRARRMDEVQYKFGDGPCLTAAQEEREIYISDIEDLAATSKYRAAMEDHGVHSVLATPILLPATSYSALNLYSTEPQAFTAAARRLARTFATHASGPLKLALTVADLADTGADLQAAMESRRTVDTAVGFIMSQNNCTRDQAIATLRQTASTRRITLRDLAESIVTKATNATDVTDRHLS